jgi:hypothetical protein
MLTLKLKNKAQRSFNLSSYQSEKVLHSMWTSEAQASPNKKVKVRPEKEAPFVFCFADVESFEQQDAYYAKFDIKTGTPPWHKRGPSCQGSKPHEAYR